MKLLLSTVALVALVAVAKAGDQASCNSTGKFTECDVDPEKLIKKMVLKDLYSAPGSCVEGETYGRGIADRTIWVDEGCQANFVVSLATPSYLNTCSGNGLKVFQFNGKRKEDSYLPCKYPVVRQECGGYFVNVVPGNIYLHPRYRLDSVWLGLIRRSDGKEWGGRTDNKLAVKYFNGNKGDLFTQKDGNLATADILRSGKDNRVTWVEDKAGTFRVSFTPWDPDSKVFKQSEWKFECFAPDFQPRGYPEQLCGGWEVKETKERAVELGLKTRAQAIYHDTFLEVFGDITQTQDGCIAAEDLFAGPCTQNGLVKDALLTCGEILSSGRQTKCVTKYSCHPMDVFVNCVRWVCSRKTDDAACEMVGASIDLCREFAQGGLTAQINAKKCYKDFLTIISKD